jgi:hypothetical protein
MKRHVTVTLAACLAALAGCQTGPGAPPVGQDNVAAVTLLQRVNSSAQTCWIKSKDKDFRGYSVIPELDTGAGKPRILVVQTKAAHGLPKLVIEADGAPVKASMYGPLSDGSLSGRIHADVTRWAAGGTSC